MLPIFQRGTQPATQQHTIQQQSATSDLQQPGTAATDNSNVNVGQLSIDQLKQILLQTLPTAVSNQTKPDVAVVQQHADQLKSRQPQTQHTQIIVSTTQPIKPQTIPHLITKPGELLTQEFASYILCDLTSIDQSVR